MNSGKFVGKDSLEETVLAVNDAETRKAGEVVEDDGTVGVEKIMAVLVAAKVV